MGFTMLNPSYSCLLLNQVIVGMTACARDR